jgi:hypothetical protein
LVQFRHAGLSLADHGSHTGIMPQEQSNGMVFIRIGATEGQTMMIDG